MAEVTHSPFTFKRPIRSFRYRLLNWGGTALSSIGVPLASLNEETLLEEAQRKSGKSDFGDENFRVPLQILLESLNQEANLTFMGRVLLRQYLLNLLINRLRIQEYLQQNPEITSVPIQRPLFILGFPRSGTTFLHNLMSQDPFSRWLHLWELYNPLPPPKRTISETDPRIIQTKKLVEVYNSLSPQLGAAHYLNPSGPEECNVLFEHDFVSLLFSLRADVPSYSEWLSNQDLLASYRYYRQQLQLLAYSWSAEHWVLKAPVHLNYLSTLMTVFPDANIIYTHRDPLKVVPSLCSLGALVRGIYTERVDLNSIGQYWLDWLANAVKRSMEMRQTIPAQQIYDLNYLELLNHPIETVSKIYSYFGYKFERTLEENLQQYITENPQYKHGIHYYSLEQFGLEPIKVTQRFENYCQKFKIFPETNFS